MESPLTAYLAAAPKHQTEIRVTFEQISLILRHELPFEARKDEVWWNNDIVNAEGPSKIWLNAGWKVVEVNLFSHEVFFARIGIEPVSTPKSFKERLKGEFDHYRRKWFNAYPKDTHHFVPVELSPHKIYWIILDENFPLEIDVQYKGKRCGYLHFTCHDRSIEICDIYVNPNHRKNGLGSYMMKFFLTLARANGFEEVCARIKPEDNFPIDRLMAWYQGFGFQATPPMSRWMVCKFQKLK